MHARIPAPAQFTLVEHLHMKVLVATTEKAYYCVEKDKSRKERPLHSAILVVRLDSEKACKMQVSENTYE